MKFVPESAGISVSEDGAYEIRSAVTNSTASGRCFFNGWHRPSGKHVGAGFEKADVVQACEEHAKRAAASTARGA